MRLSSVSLFIVLMSASSAWAGKTTEGKRKPASSVTECFEVGNSTYPFHGTSGEIQNRLNEECDIRKPYSITILPESTSPKEVAKFPVMICCQPK